MDKVERDVWIVPAAFFIMCYSKDDRYPTGNNAPTLETVINVHENDMQFYNICSLKGPSDFQSHRTSVICASKIIDLGEELYFNYPNSYNFNT